MEIAISVFVAYLFADFLSGVFHWVEDRYLTADMPWIGEHIAKPNDVHHMKPTAFLVASYWTRNWTTIVLAAPFAIVAILLGAPLWLWLAFVFLTQGNEIHAWAHRRVNVRFVRGLQEFGLLQSARHHAVHHTAPFDCRYCVMSDWLNPVLDGVRFWLALEWLAANVFGIKTKASAQ